MKKIKDNFSKNGLKYILLERAEKAVLFGIKGEYTDKIITYEVDRIYKRKANSFISYDREFIPSNLIFGKDGSLHIHNYEIAHKYFVELNNLLCSFDKSKELMVYIKKLQSSLGLI